MFGLQPRFRCQTSMGSCLERRPERSIHQKLFTLRYYTWQNLSTCEVTPSGHRGGSPLNLPSATLGAEEVPLWTCLLLPWAQRRFTFELAFCYPGCRGGSPLNLPSATLGAEEVHLWTCLLLPWAQKRFSIYLWPVWLHLVPTVSAFCAKSLIFLVIGQATSIRSMSQYSQNMRL